MNLFNNFINHAENDWIQSFAKDLSNYLKKNDRGVNDMCSNIVDEENFREEDCLYQVVDISLDGVFLQNTKNNKVFEEKEISPDLLEKLEPDFVLRYKDGDYVFEEEITDEFINSFVGIQEFREIQETFERETDILDINPDTKFRILNREEDISVLEYDDGNITVPNELLPFFVDDKTILKYMDGKFEKYIEE